MGKNLVSIGYSLPSIIIIKIDHWLDEDVSTAIRVSIKRSVVSVESTNHMNSSLLR
jgi:hypothetical protein